MKAYAALLLLSSCAFAAPHIQEDLDIHLSDQQQHVLGGFNPTGNPADVQHHIPGPPVFKTNLTIYETLAADPDYSKLVRLINFDKEFANFLNNTETTNITFFAVNNRGLTPPRRKHPHHGGGLANILEDFEALDSSVTDDGDDDEEKKKWLRKLLHALLEYHSLQVPLTKYQLSLNSTYATGLQAADGSFDGQQRRIAVTSGFGPFGPSKINFYATILPHGFDTSNGFLYTISRPLFPPPSILDELFLTKRFSTTTSALQKVGIDNWLQWRWKKKHDTKSDTTGSVVTFFAPTEEAWDKLPPKLRRYLFSPFGEKALKKVLSYHIIPDYIVHSDWFHNATKSDDFEPVEGDFSTEGLHEAAVLEYGPRLTGLPCDGHKPEVIHETLFGDSARRRRRSKRCRAGPPPGFISSDEPSMRATPATPPNIPDVPDLPTPPKFPNPPPGTPDRDHPPPHWPFPPRKPTWSVTFNETIPTLLEDTPINIFVLKPNKSLDKEALDFVLDPLDTSGGGPHPPPHSPPPPHHDPHGSEFPPFFRGAVIASHIPTKLEVPARNGAVYVVDRILRPGYRHPGHPGAPGSPSGPPPDLDSNFDDVWNDWEDWLPAWAEL